MDILIYIVAGVSAIIILSIILSGPTSTTKKAPNLQALTEQSLYQEGTRVSKWLNKYEALDEKNKKIAATEKAYIGYKDYLKEINTEMLRREFFKDLISHFPHFETLPPSMYSAMLNDPMMAIAWTMKNDGKSMKEIVDWYRTELNL